MNTYACDIWLEFPDKNPHMMVDQLFSVDVSDPMDIKGNIEAQAQAYFKKHAGASTVTLSSYIQRNQGNGK